MIVPSNGLPRASLSDFPTLTALSNNSSCFTRYSIVCCRRCSGEREKRLAAVPIIGASKAPEKVRIVCSRAMLDEAVGSAIASGSRLLETENHPAQKP
jgi:hypothetical protein